MFEIRFKLKKLKVQSSIGMYGYSSYPMFLFGTELYLELVCGPKDAGVSTLKLHYYKLSSYLIWMISLICEEWGCAVGFR